MSCGQHEIGSGLGGWPNFIAFFVWMLVSFFCFWLCLFVLYCLFICLFRFVLFVLVHLFVSEELSKNLSCM